MKRLHFFGLVMGACVVFSGCGQGGAKSPALATVNGEQITVADMDKQLEEMPPAYQEMFSDPINKEKLVTRLIKERLLLQEAKKAKLEQRDDIKKKIKAMNDQLLVQEVIKLNVIEKITISEKEVADYYKANEEKIQQYAKGKSFNEIKGQLKEIALQEKQNGHFEKWIKKLEDEAKITKNMELLNPQKKADVKKGENAKEGTKRAGTSTGQAG
ncbi:SurA N-terminal domain-containing protein [Candidatus Desantisbacteria bacterium]|nr:SurA N-terminal domain-containing protein [Candidatus Desantisbacteria bacterium]